MFRAIFCPKHVQLISEINKYCYLLHLVGLSILHNPQHIQRALHTWYFITSYHSRTREKSVNTCRLKGTHIPYLPYATPFVCESATPGLLPTDDRPEGSNYCHFYWRSSSEKDWYILLGKYDSAIPFGVCLFLDSFHTIWITAMRRVINCF
jgi:hypothetical protein